MTIFSNVTIHCDGVGCREGEHCDGFSTITEAKTARAGAPRVEVVALDVPCEPDRFGQQLGAHRGRFVDGPAAGREGNLPFGPDGEAPVEFQK